MSTFSKTTIKNKTKEHRALEEKRDGLWNKLTELNVDGGKKSTFKFGTLAAL